MAGTRKASNACGRERGSRGLAMGSNAKAVKANGSAARKETCSTESGCEGLLTYKRRKSVKVEESRKVTQDLVAQPSEKVPPLVLTDDCLLIHRRNVILEQISQSLNTEDGLRKCIHGAIASHPRSGCTTRVKESVRYNDGCSNCNSWPGTLHGLQKAVGGYVGMKSNGSTDESMNCTFTELCERSFSDIIMSENFAQLCSLLLENFQGLKTDKVFNLSQINSRMEENAYERSPMLFHSDIQEIWTKLQKVGSDITALSKCLSDKTLSSFHEQFPSQKPIMTTKTVPMDAQSPEGAHTCRRCRQEANGTNVLICDSCEGMYHISCIEPPVKEIPTRSWYCADCTSKQNEPSYENCVACKRLNTSQSNDGTNKVNILKTAESSNGSLFPIRGSRRRYTECKVCMNEIRNEEDYKICGHSLCPNTFYHVKCLTGEQLVSYGLCWYCPSCLCRACLADRDDDMIVLCDGCDHAYHIYCMVPPLDSVPEGKWFCRNCESGMARIWKAKKTYGIIPRKRGLDRKLKGKEAALNKSGGVDMLLNAAKTLNYEENLFLKGLKTGQA